MFDRRRRLLAAVLVLPVWIGTLVWSAVGAPPANAATVTTPTSCTNTAQAGTSSLPITISGAATPSSATVGTDTVTLAGATFAIDVPATTLLAGYGLGLLTAGTTSSDPAATNVIPAIVNVTLLGSNTSEASATFATGPGPDGKIADNPLTPANETADNVPGPNGFGLNVTGTTVIVDPTPANKTSGDETATPLTVTAALPTTTWTPTGGDIALSLGNTSTFAVLGGGFLVVSFTCQPGTPAPAGCGPAPLTPCTTTTPVPALPFSTVTVSGGSTTSSTSSTTTSSTTSTSTTSTSTTSTSTTSTSTTSTTAPPVVPTKVSGTGNYTTTCKNSVTPETSELQFAVTGSTMSPIEAGSTASLTNQSWEVSVPSSVLQTGINLGLLSPGDTPAGTAVVAVFASNTKEGTVTAAPVALSIGPIAVDSSGLALPAKTTFAVPNMNWTAVGGNVAYKMSSASVEVEVGPLKVKFTCTPKDPSVTIVTAGVVGKTNIPAATEVLGTTVTQAAATESLPRTGANTMVAVALAVGLIDLGYLFASAAQPARRRLRYLVQE